MKNTMNYKAFLKRDCLRHLRTAAVYRGLGMDKEWLRHMIYASQARRLAAVL